VSRPEASFEVTTTAQAMVITAAGELDLAVTGRLAALLAREIGLRPKALLFDASLVTFCGARVLTVLMDSSTHAVAAGVPFGVIGRRRSLLRPIGVLGLEQALPVHRAAAEALAWLALLPQLTELHYT
jgi:anti-anti-sigma factor